jgi:predicted O-methyltransferase YrrM
MGKRSLLPEPVEAYVLGEMTGETDVQRRLREATAALPDAGMQIGADQGVFMGQLVRLIGARRCLEVGTFTGYSALAVAMALPPEGRLITCDVSEEWTAIGRRHWELAGVSGRIELRLGPAADTLNTMLRNGEAGSFDFAFIDADKPSYDTYYELALRLLRANGAMLLDNTLWSGKVADPGVHDPDTDALRALNPLNLKIRGDRRVEACLLTIGDGVTLVRKL